MTNEKQLETDAKLPTIAQEDEITVKIQSDDERELTNEELAATVAGAANMFLKFSPD